MFLGKFKYLIFLIIIFFFLFNIASAANLKDAFPTDASKSSADFTSLEYAADGAGYDITKAEIEPVIGTVIQTALSFLGVIFIILIIYGGGLWMTAQGNEQQIEKAKNLLTAAAIGLIIVVAAYATSYFILDRLASTDAGILTNPQQ